MNGFNKQQKEAILHGDEPLMVVSSAGSGKSTTLVGRAVKKVKEGKKNLCAITFTRNTADDLTKKFKKAGVSNYIDVGTFHSICGNILRKEGVNISKRVKDYEVENLFKKIIQDEKKIDMKDIMSFISYQKNNMIGVRDDFVEKDSCYGEDQLRECFKAYEDYKAKVGAYDFDDYLILGYKILTENPNKYVYDYLFVDETQDSNEIQMKIVDLLCPSGRITVFGDAQQCIPVDTLIKTSDGDKKIQDLTKEDKIIVGNGRGNTIEVNPTNILSRLYDGELIVINTKSGKQIKCTPEHIIFANPNIKKKYCVYLMHSNRLGFRIGISGNLKGDNGFEQRLRAEEGNRIWCLKTLDSKQEATFYEQYYSYEYGLPQYVFKHDKYSNSSLNQDMIDNLFMSIDTTTRGNKLLKDLNMYFNYPHYMPNGSSKVTDLSVGITIFGNHDISKGSKNPYVGNYHEFSISNTNKELVEYVCDNVEDLEMKVKKNGNGLTYYGVRKNSFNQDYLIDLGEKVSKLKDGINVNTRIIISKSKDKMSMYPASNIREGMDIVCYENNELINDEVVSVSKEKYSGFVYDINVDYYRNYVANDLCVHNCMYSFRGSRPELFMDFYKSHPSTNVINMNINYRSHKEIVEKSNDFIRQYYGDYEYYSDAIPNSDEHAEIELMVNDLAEAEAQDVCDKVQTLLSLGYKGSDIAILFRNNVQSQHIENEFKVRDVDYFIESEGGFFNRKEIDIIMCMLRLIDNPEDDSAFEKLFRYRCEPFVFLANNILSDIISLSAERNISHLEASQLVHVQAWQSQKLRWFANTIEKLVTQYNSGYTLLQLINNIIKTLDMDNYIKTNYPNEEDQKERLESLENLKKFIRSNTLDTFLKFVYEKNTSSENKNSENKIQMMTVHKSKGLEFKVVFVVGIATGKFPSEKSYVEEEANVFYVAITRAIERMYLSQIGTYNVFLEQYFGEDKYPMVVQDAMF